MSHGAVALRRQYSFAAPQERPDLNKDKVQTLAWNLTHGLNASLVVRDEGEEFLGEEGH